MDFLCKNCSKPLKDHVKFLGIENVCCDYNDYCFATLGTQYSGD